MSVADDALCEDTASMVDVAFALSGRTLPREHGPALAHALLRRLPWLALEPGCAVHRVKVATGSTAEALLPRRARLLLRVPRERAPALQALDGALLDVAGHRLQLGAPRVHELLAHATLYAGRVAADAEADEAAFLRTVADELAALDVRGRCICGLRRQRRDDVRDERGDDAPLDGFSLMLDGLTPAHSLRLQQRGIGPYRLMGCGVFVPHRSAAALHGAPA